MAKQKQKKKSTATKKEMYKPKELNNEKKKKKKESGQIMSLLSNMYKKIIFICFLFTTLCTTKWII
jgi:hypothetical protein